MLDSVRFSVGGIECDKIGVSYEAFNAQPNFCSSPLRSCLHNQLSDFWEVSILHTFDKNCSASCFVLYKSFGSMKITFGEILIEQSDQNRIGRNQTPEYAVQARFGRINQHPVMSHIHFFSFMHL